MEYCSATWVFVLILFDFCLHEQQKAIKYCLRNEKEDLLELLLAKSAEYHPVCPFSCEKWQQANFLQEKVGDHTSLLETVKQRVMNDIKPSIDSGVWENEEPPKKKAKYN